MEKIVSNNAEFEKKVKVSTRVHSRKQGVTAYAENPFWRPTEVKVGTKKITIAGGFVTNTGTGEQTEYAGLHKVEFVDEEKFVKLFTQNLKAFFDLSSASQKVLQCVLIALQASPNKDGIFLPFFMVEDYAQQTEQKISRTTFHRALKEMLEKGFIAESEQQNYFYINPHLFFNGDRMTFIHEYRRLAGGKTPDEAKRDKLEEQGQQRLDV